MNRPCVEALQLSFLPNETLVWQRGPVIGTGRFGEVVLALRIPSAECIAVKQIYIQEEVELGNDTSALCMQRLLPLAKIEREVDIVQSLQHPNIVQYLGCDRHGPVYRIFMEYVPSGSLGRILREMGPFKETTARHVVRQVLDGVAYLHRLGVAHRDLKCANLLLADDGTLKISDFGAATRSHGSWDTEHEVDGDETGLSVTEDSKTARSVRDGLGSPFWMAPELVRAECGEDGWRKADIWGVGCVLIELVTAKPPWENHSNPLTAMFHIASKNALPPFPASLSAAARSFLENCFQKDPDARPSPEVLLQHPFIRGEKVTDTKNTAEEKERKDPKLRPSHSLPNNDDESRIVALSNDPPDLLLSHENQDRDCVAPPTLATRSDLAALAAPNGGERADSSGCDEEAEAVAYSSDGDTEHVEQQELSESFPAIEPSVPFVTERNEEPKKTDWTPLGRVRALASYHSIESNELALEEGDTLLVTGANEYGWWQGCNEGAVRRGMGWFPCTYVEWIPQAAPFEVLAPHDPPSGDDHFLLLRVHDSVNVLRCEWRDESLWSFGVTTQGDRTGWFPFACIHPGSK